MNEPNRRKSVKNLTGAAICLALCMFLPLLTAQIPHIGMALAPMHIPVLLCAFVTGPRWAVIVGTVAPLLRFLIFGMPFLPMAVSMSFELAVYGLVAGALYTYLPKKPLSIYISLITAMAAGRFVWGAAFLRIAGIVELPPFIPSPFDWDAFVTMAFISAWPGIVLHIVLIPIVVMALKKTKVLHDP